MQVLATYTGAGFNPSILGPIDSIDYSYDRQNFPEAAFREVNDRLAILQDGKVYFRSMGNVATDTNSSFSSRRNAALLLTHSLTLTEWCQSVTFPCRFIGFVVLSARRKKRPSSSPGKTQASRNAESAWPDSPSWPSSPSRCRPPHCIPSYRRRTWDANRASSVSMHSESIRCKISTNIFAQRPNMRSRSRRTA